MTARSLRDRLPRRTLWLLLLLVAVAVLASAFHRRAKARREADAMAYEVALHRSEKRPDAVIGYEAWSTIRNEADLAARLAGLKLDCRADWTEVKGAARTCAVDLKSLNGVPTMYVNFTFSDRALIRVSTVIPGEFHAQGLAHLTRSLGEPTVRQSRAHAGLRLDGWILADGSTLFYNRDPASARDGTNSIQWLPKNGCDGHPCITAP